MYRVKEAQKKHVSVWTNKSFSNCQDGTLPNTSKKKTTQEPESKANQKSKSFQEPKAKSCRGLKDNQEPKTNQESKSYQKQSYKKPKTNQESWSYQSPRSLYQDPTSNPGLKSKQGETFRQGQNFGKGWKYNQWQGQEYKHFNQGSKSKQGPKAYQGPKSYYGLKGYKKPGIYQPEAPLKKYKDYKVPEITVSELCRTLTGLKAMEEATTTNDSRNSENGTSPANEPFFASNLEYYPHLPQVYYSQEYQTFAELKASVCQGDLTQVKPPVDYDYHFLKEWRETFQTTEQRQAYLRNQRALNAQRIGRQQRQQEQTQDQYQEQDPSDSKGTGTGTGTGTGLDHSKPPPMEDRFVQGWLETCENVGHQREFRLRQAMQAEFSMRAQDEMVLGYRRQEFEKEQEQEQEQELKNQQQKHKEHEERMEQQESGACFFEEQKKLGARFLKDQKELEVRRQKEKDQQKLIARLQEEQELKKLQEIEARKQQEHEEQQELEARIQRQKKAMEFVAQLQKEFEEQKQKEEDEDEARRQERDLLQARLRNERAKTAQRVARETRRCYEQRQYEFRFGPKDMAAGQGASNHVTTEQLSKMPTVPTVPRAPLASELPQPMPAMFNGKTFPGNGN